MQTYAQHNLESQSPTTTVEYGIETARMTANVMKEFNAVMLNAEPNASFVETYTLKKASSNLARKGIKRLMVR
jgi:hypothetical protein